MKKNIGLKELNPQLSCGFQDLYHKTGTKIHNCFFIGVEVKKEAEKEFFLYSGDIVVDFDARTGHNHGTKFRFRNSRLNELYENVEAI
ncbi:MvaI/BcnI family restriction endonuclease [Candidatus Rickettsia kedanie]|uniref:MvaI/BcnI restriction endonuclease domain-containing protein n=1 Tax=Candidatus Rickettsia kedanie TaxID=3115352 RepID=A0ABP9TSA0_9RICK